jgi:hypothetical protein
LSEILCRLQRSAHQVTRVAVVELEAKHMDDSLNKPGARQMEAWGIPRAVEERKR